MGEGDQIPLAHSSMAFTDDQTVALGQFCESLMQSDAFNAIHELFKQQCIDATFNSAPDAKEDRERAYAELHGVSKFLGVMRTLVQQSAQVIARNDAAQKQEPTPIIPDDDGDDLI